MPEPGRILVITYHFPPDGAVGGLRWAGLSKYLTRLGWEVHILTAAEGADAGTRDVHVHQCTQARTLNDAYRRLRQRHVSRGTSSGTVTEHRSPDTPSIGRALASAVRREVGTAMVFPDDSRGWILRATRKARRLVRQKEFDYVVSSGPPHSVHVIAALSRRRVPLVLDYRDPWTFALPAEQATVIHQSLLSRAMLGRLEKYALGSASIVLSVTDSYTEELRARLPGVRVRWLSNGVDPERLPPEPSDGPVAPYFSHVGTLYGGRNLGPVLRALRSVLDHNELAEPPRLRLAGSMKDSHRDRLLEQIHAGALEAEVDVLGMVPPDEALELTRRSRLSIVLAQDQKMQIPAKLYESVALGVPTLVLAEKDSASYREAARIGAWSLEPEDVPGIARVLSETAAGGTSVSRDAVEAVGYGGLARRLEEILIEASAA